MLQNGPESWSVGSGLALHPDISTDWRDRFVFDARVVRPLEAGATGSLVAVHYSGWDLTDAEEHYLRMVAWGTTRDAQLDPYLQADFWFCGRHPTERIAYLARTL